MKYTSYQNHQAFDKLITVKTGVELLKVDEMKVLIVDVSPERIEVLQEILSELKLNISKSLIGDRALSLFRAATPDLIMLDVDIFGMDGYEICQMIRANNKSNPIPIIYITSATKTAEIIKGLPLGAADYILRPFNEQDVIQRVYKQLALRKCIVEQQPVTHQENFIHLKNDPLTNAA
jgi:DNA-binding response OmpR family regulator